MVIRSIKCLFCNQKDLSSVPRIYINPGREGRIHEAPWPGFHIYIIKPRLIKDLVSKNNIYDIEMASKKQYPNLYSNLLMHVPTNTRKHTTHMRRWVGRKRRRRGRLRGRRRRRRIRRRGRGGGGSCLISINKKQYLTYERE